MPGHPAYDGVQDVEAFQRIVLFQRKPEIFFKKAGKPQAEVAGANAQTADAAGGFTVVDNGKLPLILRWPISIIFLFVMPPFGTAVGIGLAVARLIFNHKYPKYKLKLWTKLIISALCIAFVIWAVVTAPESSTTTSAEAVPTEQGESQATETTSEATENKTVEQETTSQAEQQAASEQKKQEEAVQAAKAETEKQQKEAEKQQRQEEKAAKKLARQQKRANKKIEKALGKDNIEKAAKKLSHVKENWVYAYYQQMLPDLIEQDDRTQLDRYLTIYRQAFP